MSEISFLFCGDFAPCRRFEAVVLEKGGAVFGGLRDYISSADIAFANLESPLCVDGKPIAKSGPALKANPKCAAALAEAGFNVAGLANNHIMDFGREGLESTMAICARHGLKTCGAGVDDSKASEPLWFTVNGTTIALLALAEKEFNAAGKRQPGAAIIDPVEIYRKIARLRESTDIVLVTIHGGNEYFPYPRPGLRRLCKFIVEAGADAVICHHSHVPGAYEIHQGAPIVYSLGNLIFDSDPAPSGWEEGYAVKLAFRRNDQAGYVSAIELIPYRQSVRLGGVKLIEGAEKEKFVSRVEGYRQVLADEPAWEAEWKSFCRKQRSHYIAAQYIPFRFPGMGRVIRYLCLEKFFLPRRSIDRRKNMIWCDSHRELLLEILEQE